MRRSVKLSLIGFFIVFLSGPILAGESLPRLQPLWREGGVEKVDPELERLSAAFERLAAEVRPSVVQIRANGRVLTDTDGTESSANSRGSGFIINPQGYILTAHHVIESAPEIEVVLSDGRRMHATLIASEPQVDVALLKVDGEGLPVLALGDSAALKVGELVVSLSYPFGRESALSMGVISRRGMSRNVLAGFDFIQTNAGASAGSSGGPLVNIRGEAVGMITMASQTGNIGFAVPISVIKNIIPRLLEGKKIVWGWLGVRVSELTFEQADRLGLPMVKGVFVNSVLPGQPAEKSKILPHDVILEVNGVEVDNPREFTRLIGGIEAGNEVSLTIFRKGETLQRSAVLAPRPKEIEGREG